MMRLKIAVDIRVKQRHREVSGSTSWITKDLLAFRLRGPALHRGLAELQLVLVGTAHHVQATIRVLTIDLGGVSGRNQYTARIQSMSGADRSRLEAWVQERTNPSSSSSSGSRTTPARREKLREALHSESDLVDGPPPDAIPDAIPDADELVLAPRVKLASDGSSLSVEWANWSSVKASWAESLSEGSLRVYLEGRHPPRGYSLILQLRLPDGKVYATMGQAGNSDGRTLYLTVRLKESIRKALTRQ